MKKKHFYYSILVSAMAASSLILYAQVRNREKMKEMPVEKREMPHSQDTTTLPDNTYGLSELDKIAKRYESKNLRITGDILYYENADSVKHITEKSSFVSINTPSAISYEVDSVQSIMYRNSILMVDKREKSIMLMERQNGLNRSFARTLMASSIEEFRDYILSVTVSSEGTDRKLMILFRDDSPANTSDYEIVYEPETYRIKKVTMEITDGEITDEPQDKEDDELVYTDENNEEISTGYYAKVKTTVYKVIYKSEEKASEEMVQMNHFLKKGKNTYLPSRGYENYEVINGSL